MAIVGGVLANTHTRTIPNIYTFRTLHNMSNLVVWRIILHTWNMFSCCFRRKCVRIENRNETKIAPICDLANTYIAHVNGLVNVCSFFLFIFLLILLRSLFFIFFSRMCECVWFSVCTHCCTCMLVFTVNRDFFPICFFSSYFIKFLVFLYEKSQNSYITV